MEQKSNNKKLQYRIISQQRGNLITLECLNTQQRIDIAVEDLLSQPDIIHGLIASDLSLIQFIAEEMATYE